MKAVRVLGCGALVWIDAGEARLRVDGDGDPVAASLDAHDRRIAAGADDGVGADHLVVGAVEHAT